MTYFSNLSATELKLRNEAVKRADIERKQRCEVVMARYKSGERKVKKK